MGWNQGYTIAEATVVGAYNLGRLDKELLAILFEPYRGTDIDSGGSKRLLGKDGKTFEEIVVTAWGLELPEQPKTDRKKGGDDWDLYREVVYDEFQKVTDHFGWE